MTKYFVAVLLIGTAWTQSRPYFPVTIEDLAAGKVLHTHVQVTGKVLLVAHQKDGDLHIRLGEGRKFIVAECIKQIPCIRPKVGDGVTVRGISRFDREHKWWEVHPVEGLIVSSPPNPPAALPN